jgi:hypothetical protein
MNDTIIIMLNMRGSCATDGEKVHALFRVNNRLGSAKRDSDRLEKHGPEIIETCEDARLAERRRGPRPSISPRTAAWGSIL